MRNRVTDYFAYRWRYILGYSFIAIVIACMLIVAGGFVPHELRQGEIDSALTSSKLGTSAMSPESVIDLPYHLLQKLSIMALGVTTFSIKLPSLFLGTLTALGIFLLIRAWFKPNAAVLATLLAVVNAQFLFLVQDGTPLIMYTFISIWLLALATHVTRRKYFGTLWKVLTALAMAACIYTPMGIYLVIVMIVTSLFHPHIRFMIRKLNPYKAAVAMVLGIAALAPLVYAAILKPSILKTIFSIPVAQIDMKANFLQVISSSFGFTANTSSYLIQPLYPLGIAILMGIGLVQILSHRYTARSYITIAWGIITLALVLCSPAAVTNLYPVAIILMSYGMIYMINSWYMIFPTNPYARVAGMIPLVVLVLAFVTSGITRYIGTYHNDPAVLKNYSSDLTIFRKALTDQHASTDTTQVIVSDKELPLYQLVNKYDKRFTVSSVKSDRKAITIASHDARLTDAPAKIVVNTRSDSADRFYIYK